MKYAIVALTLLAFAPSARAADAKAEAQKIADAFVAAVNIKDPQKSVPAVLALFTEDMQHIGIFGRVHGKKELAPILNKAFVDPNRHVTLGKQDAFQLDPGTIQSTTHFDNVISGPDGKPMSLPLRCTRTLVKQKNGRWLIAAEHTSFGPPPPPPPPAMKDQAKR